MKDKTNKMCKCKDWKENINKLNAGAVMSFIHGMGGYSGKIFSFCPWCGKKLIKKNVDYGSKRKTN